MGLGLLSIPILLHALGDRDFAALAVLTGGSLLFYCLEVGMPSTLVRYIARAEADTGGRPGTDVLLSNATFLLAVIYSIAVILVAAFAPAVAAWLDLPDTPLLSAPELILFVAVSVSVTSVAKLALCTLEAAGRFPTVAALTASQGLAVNAVTWVVALLWRRLDLVLLAFWATQLATVIGSRWLARRIRPWRMRLGHLDGEVLSSLIRHGIYLQCSTLFFLTHFQLDKWLISATIGLREVARYEIGSRAAQALRNLPGSALGTFLPPAASGDIHTREAWEVYRQMTRAAACSAVLFLLLPLGVSPLFLFAWAGEIGYHGRWVFAWVAVALCADIVGVPVSSFVQAMGRTALDAKYACAGLVLHVALAAALVGRFGKEGVAAAGAIGIVGAQLGYLSAFHRIMDRRLGETIGMLWHEFRLALLVCAACAMIAAAIKPWIIASRWYMAPASVALYVGCLAALGFLYRSRLQWVAAGWRSLSLASLLEAMARPSARSVIVPGHVQ
jgi:O-antigen/teichoic acid export membrane protein